MMNHALVTSLLMLPYMHAIPPLNETFETNPGYDETWNVSESGTGAIDPDDALLTMPPSWGSEAASVFAAQGDVASIEHTIALAPAKFYYRIEVVVTSYLNLGTSGAMNLSFARDASFNQIFAFGILKHTDNSLRFNMEVWDDGTMTQYTFNAPTVDTLHILEFEWNTTSDVWAWFVDGSEVASGILTSPADTRLVKFIKAGAEFVNTTGDGEYYMDNIAYSPDGFIWNVQDNRRRQKFRR